VVRTRVGRVLAVSLTALVVHVAPPAQAAQCSIGAGYDLFQTHPDTRFDPLTLVGHVLSGVLPQSDPTLTVGLRGVPLGQYDFGPLGVRPTAATDTIVRRLAPANPGQHVVPIELVALQLQVTRVGPVALDVPVFVTLQSRRGVNALDPPPGPASTGTLDIAFAEGCAGGTLDSAFTVNFDLRLGSLDGPIIPGPPGVDPGSSLSLRGVGTPWSSTVDTVVRRVDEYEQAGSTWHSVVGPPTILDGVNRFVPGGDISVGTPAF
jgi:hypothetical protein